METQLPAQTLDPFEHIRPVPQHSDGEFLRFRLDPSEVVNEFEMFLRRKILNDETGKYEHELDYKGVPIPPLANGKGIASLCSTLRLHLDKFVVLTAYDDEDIRRLAIQANIAIIRDLANHYQEYGMDITVLDKVRENMDSIIFAALKRAHNAGERNSIGKTHHTNEQIMWQQAEARRHEEGKRRFALFR